MLVDLIPQSFQYLFVLIDPQYNHSDVVRSSFHPRQCKSFDLINQILITDSYILFIFLLFLHLFKNELNYTFLIAACFLFRVC